MEIDEAIHRLEAAGLLVIRDPSSLADHMLWLFIARSVENHNGFDVRKDNSAIYYKKEHWTFKKWDWVPGPGPDDVKFQAANLEHAVKVLLNYYFGEPIILNKWILPAHKHPEWPAEQLQAVIENAVQIASEKWQAIYADSVRMRNELHPLGTLSQIFACSFNPISTSENPTLILYVRRDLGMAFIVDKHI